MILPGRHGARATRAGELGNDFPCSSPGCLFRSQNRGAIARHERSCAKAMSGPSPFRDDDLERLLRSQDFSRKAAVTVRRPAPWENNVQDDVIEHHGDPAAGGLPSEDLKRRVSPFSRRSATERKFCFVSLRCFRFISP